MAETPAPAGWLSQPAMCRLLRACGPVNVLGALIFAPPLPWVRDLFGLPAAPPLYLWVLSIWILAFGAAYWHLGNSGRIENTFLAVAAAGKGSFALLILAYAAAGTIPATAILLGLPDLALAAWFTAWLVEVRRQSPGA
ncbi:MAG TPA: hypothetical protein VGK20_01860 [Candidatus Binatia bacterium]|jgi:hypothetical protein